MTAPAPGRLIDAASCALVLVDVQQGFLARVEDARRLGLVERIGLLVRGARFLGVPVVATVESPARWGGVHPGLAPLLGEAPVVEKTVFGAGDDPAVLPALAATGRTTAVLVGTETDVCIAQSALSLLDRGWRVACVEDAVASPGTAHDAGIRRMRRAGVVLLSTKALHYEWLRTVARAEAFRAAHPDLVEPPGVLL